MENLPKLINVTDNSTINVDNFFFSIGRSLICNHVIESIGVSRVHCFIKKNDTKYTLIDRSTNGTIVNGKLVKFNGCIDLNNGDSITFGRISYKFDDGTKPIEKMDEKHNQPTTSKTVVNVNDNSDNNDNDTESPPITLDASFTTINTAEITNEVLSAAEEFEIPFEPTNSNNSDDNDKKIVIESVKKEPDENAMDPELTCSICSELFIKAVTLTCSHSFCKYCIGEWQKKKNQCPICRQRITTISPTIVLDNLVERIVSSRPKEEQESRQEQIKLREEKLPIAGPSNERKRQSHARQEQGARRSRRRRRQQPDDESIDTTIHVISDDDDEDDDIDFDMDIVDPDDMLSDFLDDYDDDDDSDGDYTGVPGHYYGGYGSCYVCGDRGHWANGCPFKRRH